MPLLRDAFPFGLIAVLWFLVVSGPARWFCLVPAAIAVYFLIEHLITRRHLGLAVTLLLAFLLVPTLALAADPITVGSLFGDMRETVFAVLSTIAAGIVSLGAWGVWRLTGVKLDESSRKALHSAMENGIHAGLNAVQAAADKTRFGALNNDVVQVALRYVKQFAPDAVRHFGLDDAALKDLLKAQLGKIVPIVPSA